ncbi:MAG: hypothetical protein K2X39_07540, partial [Silvanigrellaceae bacterium]|nr:hypothetical protein [Silvanigrellaceae bacterium]
MSEGAKEVVAQACKQAFHILALYYDFDTYPNFKPFLYENAQTSQNCGKVFFDHIKETDELYIGLNFGKDFYQEHKRFNLNEFAIIAEETSHFKLLIDAFQQQTKVTRLNLEMLGEIDRFIVLMHSCFIDLPFTFEPYWKNLHELCDIFFQGQRFPHEPEPLYFDAETLALYHLQQAFFSQWDNTYVDFQKISYQGKQYLKKLRQQILNHSIL